MGAQADWLGNATAAHRPVQGSRCVPLSAMAFRRPMLCTMAIATMALWLLNATLMPAFAGVRPSAEGRASRVTRHAVDDGSIEIMVTIPNLGARTRLEVYRDTTFADIKKEARTLLGFTQPFLKEEDWKMYYGPDESIELAGKMGDYPDKYVGWGPDGFEIHMRYEPRR